jgi:PAS domain-containing protein
MSGASTGPWGSKFNTVSILIITAPWLHRLGRGGPGCTGGHYSGRDASPRRSRGDPLRRWSAPPNLSYRRLFEAAKDGILILDADTGRITDVNPFLYKLLGFSRSEMVGKTVGELSPFKDIVSNRSCLSDYKRTGMSAMKTCRWKPRMAARLPWSLSATCIKPVTKK